MLADMIDDLVKAESMKDVEKAYRMLEKVGVDRKTATILAKERAKETGATWEKNRTKSTRSN